MGIVFIFTVLGFSILSLFYVEAIGFTILFATLSIHGQIKFRSAEIIYYIKHINLKGGKK